MKIEYSSNNSGGSWWLSDEQWRALEAAGWEVEWRRDDAKRAETRAAELRADGQEKEAADTLRFASIGGSGERWLGALATRASKECATPADAIRDFEAITGLDASDEGCNCCGAPHSFSWHEADGSYNYASGNDIVATLYANAPTSLREAAKRLAGES